MKMVFGSGKGAHEAFLARQEAEARFLEGVKRCLVAKAKSDKEYAHALLAAASSGQKLEGDRGEKGEKGERGETGCGLWSAWSRQCEVWEARARRLKRAAEAFDSRILERLTSLCGERRRARKTAQEEFARAVQRFAQLSDEVVKKQSDYQKHLEQYRQTRTKFEEHYVKSPSQARGKKLDETRDKYQKACRKLHLTHNEYVLLLAAAAECERDLKTVQIPGIVARQRLAQEAFVAACREVLLDVARSFDIATEQCVEAQRGLETAIGNIEPHGECGDSSDPGPPASDSATFTFDPSLVRDTSGKLQANQLTVDNLTVDWLRNKLQELEAGIAENRERQAALQGETHGGEDGRDGEAPDGSCPASDVVGNGETRELSELRRAESQWSKQADLLRNALSELGCEEAPSGCPDPPTPPPSPPRPPVDDDHQGDGSSLASSSLRRHLLSVLPQRKILEAFGKPFRRKSAPCSPAPSVRRSLRGGSEGPSGVFDPSIRSSTRPLVDEEWFHGVLPREEVVRLLRVDGDFLVRETTRNDECQTVLSVCWGGHKHFIVQTTQEGHYRFEGPAFPSVRELILHQQNSGSPVTGRSGAILRRPVPRERWELNNDDVVLMEKIGRGNFGDVYKAHLKSSKQEVAVKTCRMTLPDEQKRTFLQEGRILKQYEHRNIVRLIGICVQKQPIMIVMELVSGGSLLTFLRTRASTLTQKQLVGMCRDASAGMQYLESKNCIHRDLAARNCLVGKDHVVKISDFGMSREEEEYIVSGGMKQIPIKWTAPEALNFGKYTSLCDVWSYGILMWEIFSKGDTPYAGYSNSKAREKIDSGYRMPSPEDCPEKMYQLMLECWQYDPESRPHFDQIYSRVDELYEEIR